MTYTRSTPNTGESLNFTRPIINTNFDQIFQQFAKNHGEFNSAESGKHTEIQMVQIAAPATLINETAMYNKAGLYAPNEPCVFVRGQSNGFEYQFTNPNEALSSLFGTFTAINGTTLANSNYGWTFLPGGLILNYGTRSGLDSQQNIPYARPFTTSVFLKNAIITAITPITANVIPSASLTEIDITNSGTAANKFVYWFAIGI